MSTSSISAANVSLELDAATAHQMRVKSLPDGGYEITTTGDDPYIYTPPLKSSCDPVKQFILSFDYFCDKGLSDVQLFFGDPAAAERCASGPALSASEGWSSYAMNLQTHQEGHSWTGGYGKFRMDFGRHAGRTIQLRNIQLRPPTEEELKDVRTFANRRQEVAAFDAKLQAMIETEYHTRIMRAQATESKIRITITAAVVYTWMKFEQLQSIESYVMHRWMDAPDEGGLNLGLRTFGKTEETARKKLAWDIYRKLATPDQPQVVQWAKTVIPAQYFNDIPAKVHP